MGCACRIRYRGALRDGTSRDPLGYEEVPKKPPLIAVVDDDPFVRKALERLIGSTGLSVESFASGAEFLRSADDHQPDCVVLDLHMQEMSGFEVQSRLARAHPRVPVVVITGHDTPESRSRSLGGGGRNSAGARSGSEKVSGACGHAQNVTPAAWSTIFAPFGTENLNFDGLSAGFAVKLVMTTCRFKPLAFSTSNCLMLESASSIHTFAVVKLAFGRFGTRVTACVARPATVSAPADVTVNRARGEFRNCSAGSTAPAFAPVYGIRMTWPGVLLGR